MILYTSVRGVVHLSKQYSLYPFIWIFYCSCSGVCVLLLCVARCCLIICSYLYVVHFPCV
jgi:hypothetical protein